MKGSRWKAMQFYFPRRQDDFELRQTYNVTLETPRWDTQYIKIDNENTISKDSINRNRIRLVINYNPPNREQKPIDRFGKIMRIQFVRNLALIWSKDLVIIFKIIRYQILNTKYQAFGIKKNPLKTIYISLEISISRFSFLFFPFINRTKLDINGASEMDTPRKFHNNLDTRFLSSKNRRFNEREYTHATRLTETGTPILWNLPPISLV